MLKSNNAINVIFESIQRIDYSQYYDLIELCCKTIDSGGRIIISGLGKNSGVCNKVADSMQSIGIKASYIHTGEALHGALGAINDGDLVILTSKSGNTYETIQMAQSLKRNKRCIVCGLTFNRESELVKEGMTDHSLILDLKEEGDPWNLMPMNSVTIILIILQCLTLEIIDRLGLTKEEFLKNHPGGGIGKANMI